MKPNYPRIIIAGMKGGAGKTTVSLGLIAAWKKQGLSIVPYKKGPDYIDAGWLSSAAGHACFNLDPFLITKEKIVSSFAGHYGKADCAVIEGNRGLYDGMDAAGTYSTAELSKTLNAPVILVLDCTKVTRTAAAMLLGMLKFDPKVKISGVVLNQIAGKRHERVIREAIAKYCKVPVVGAIPKLRGEQLSERHMGLTPFQEHPEVKKAIAACADIAEKYLDLEAIQKIAHKAGIGDWGLGIGNTHHSSPITHHGLRIGIIRDSAFQFYYPENFEELEKRGAELVEISALKAKKLPDIDALYIGGGFPETHAIALAKNKNFKNALKAAVEQGLPVYAECGGLMYLGDALVLDRKTYPMAGIFPLRFSLEKKPQAHGYTIVKVAKANPFYKRGTLIRGHEFHYSCVIKPLNKEFISISPSPLSSPSSGEGKNTAPPLRGGDEGEGVICGLTNGRLGKKNNLQFAFRMERGEGIMDGRDGICYKNVLATYTHLHALGCPEWAEGMIRQAIAYRKGRQ